MDLQPIASFDKGSAIIGYANLLTAATISAGTTDPSKALTPNTYDRWRPTAALLTAKFQLASAADVDYIAIAAHGLSGETILLQTAATAGGALTDVESVTFANNDPIMITFDSRNIEEIAIVATYTAVTEIGVVYAGEYLQMPRAIYGGHSPIALSSKTDYLANISESGNFLGRNVNRLGLETPFNWQNLDDEWIRNTFLTFVESARTLPFFIKWRPDFYKDEVAFGYTTNNVRISNQGGGVRLMSASFNMKAHRDN